METALIKYMLESNEFNMPIADEETFTPVNREKMYDITVQWGENIQYRAYLKEVTNIFNFLNNFYVKI